MTASAWDAYREIGVIAGVVGDSAAEVLRLIADRIEGLPTLRVHAVTFGFDDDRVIATVIATDEVIP